jgi:hypothetical protein
VELGRVRNAFVIVYARHLNAVVDIHHLNFPPLPLVHDRRSKSEVSEDQIRQLSKRALKKAKTDVAAGVGAAAAAAVSDAHAPALAQPEPEPKEAHVHAPESHAPAQSAPAHAALAHALAPPSRAPAQAAPAPALLPNAATAATSAAAAASATSLRHRQLLVNASTSAPTTGSRSVAVAAAAAAAAAAMALVSATAASSSAASAASSSAAATASASGSTSSGAMASAAAAAAATSVLLPVADEEIAEAAALLRLAGVPADVLGNMSLPGGRSLRKMFTALGGNLEWRSEQLRVQRLVPAGATAAASVLGVAALGAVVAQVNVTNLLPAEVLVVKKKIIPMLVRAMTNTAFAYTAGDLEVAQPFKATATFMIEEVVLKFMRQVVAEEKNVLYHAALRAAQTAWYEAHMAMTRRVLNDLDTQVKDNGGSLPASVTQQSAVFWETILASETASLFPSAARHGAAVAFVMSAGTYCP